MAIATVLAMYPSILVMDEPSSSLDPRARRRVIELLRSFSHTKIIATHDLDLALDVCERTIVMSAGAVIADGPTLDIFRDDALLQRSGLGAAHEHAGLPGVRRASGGAATERLSRPPARAGREGRRRRSLRRARPDVWSA